MPRWGLPPTEHISIFWTRASTRSRQANPFRSRPLPSAPAAETRTLCLLLWAQCFGSSVLAEGTKSPHRRMQNQERTNQRNHQQGHRAAHRCGQRRPDRSADPISRSDWPIHRSVPHSFLDDLQESQRGPAFPYPDSPKKPVKGPTLVDESVTSC